MPRTCCVKTCHGVGGHKFPRDENIRAAWITAIQTVNTSAWKYNKSKLTVICSAHFTKEDYYAETLHGTKPVVKYLRKHAVPSIFSMTKGPKPPKKPKKPKVVHRIKEVYVVKIKTAKQECDGSPGTSSNKGVGEVTIQKQDLTSDAVQQLFTSPTLPYQQRHQQKQHHHQQQQHRSSTDIDANLRHLVDNVLLPGTLGQGVKNLDSRITVMSGHGKPETSRVGMGQCSNHDAAHQSQECFQMIEPKVEIKQEKEDYVETKIWNVVT